MEVFGMVSVNPNAKTEEHTENNDVHNSDFYQGEPEYIWRPHLKDAVPPAGQGKRISTYTIALEGWRRGLELNFYSLFEDGNKLKVRYSLSNGEKTHHFSLSMGDRVSDKAFEICDDKDLTKQYLRKGNVPVTEGKMFGLYYSMEKLVPYRFVLGF